MTSRSYTRMELIRTEQLTFTPSLPSSLPHPPSCPLTQVVFASSDQGQEAFDSYHAEMPWLAIDYADRAKKDALSKKYVTNSPIFVFC